MKRLTAFIMQDNYTSLAIYRQVDGSFVYENLGHMGELYEPGGFYGLRDLLRGLFPSAPQVEELETACGAVADVDESADLVPDVEMLFQFLIGRLKTRRRPKASAGLLSFNSS